MAKNSYGSNGEVKASIKTKIEYIKMGVGAGNSNLYVMKCRKLIRDYKDIRKNPYLAEGQ